MIYILQDVRIGCIEGPQLSLDLEESLTMMSMQSSGGGGGGGSLLSSSPPQSGRQSPPAPTTPSSQQFHEPLELQIDYWPIARPTSDNKEKSQTKGQEQGKNSIKSTFRNLQVSSFCLIDQIYSFKVNEELCSAGLSFTIISTIR